MSLDLELAGDQTRRRGRNVAVLLFCALLLSTIVAVLTIPRFGFARLYRVPTEGMLPTLLPGDQLYATSLLYVAGKPKRGDIVVFTPPDDAVPGKEKEIVLFKRVAGLPGEKISIKSGRFYAQDRLVNELSNREYVIVKGDYLYQDGGETIVPDNAYFLLGDNSASSYDSRYWGAVPKKNIQGRVIFRYWPFSRIGLL